MNTAAMPRNTRSRLPLIMIALVCIAPMVAAYIAFEYFPRDSRTNYGTLLMTEAPALSGTALDGKPFALADLKGRWVVLTAAPGSCDAVCVAALYATRQARTIQGRERDRVTRVWLMPTAAVVPSAVTPAQPGLVIARVPAPSLASLPLIETRMLQRRPAFAAHQQRVSMVIPWFPR